MRQELLLVRVTILKLLEPRVAALFQDLFAEKEHKLMQETGSFPIG